MEAFGESEWSRRIRRVLRDGFANFNTAFIITQVLVPLLVPLLDALLVPFFVSRLLCVFVQSYHTQTLISRYVYLAAVGLCLLGWLLRAAVSHLGKVYEQLVDSRYLLGTELANR